MILIQHTHLLRDLSITAGNPRLYEITIVITAGNQNKLVNSIYFAIASSQSETNPRGNIFAIA